MKIAAAGMERGAISGLLTGPAAWILLTLAAVLPFIGSMTAGFTYDDRGVILENRAIWAPSPHDAWNSTYWPGRTEAGLYRPWVTLSYWMNARLTGRGPAGFHAMNLALNAAVCLLLWQVLRRLFPHRPGGTWITACLFAIHPLHAEAVVSIVGRAELWAALGGLAAWRLALQFQSTRNWPFLAGSALLFAIALLSKESAAGLLLLPVAHAILDREAGRTRRWAAIVLVAWMAALAVVLLLRAHALHGVRQVEGVGLVDNALAREPAPRRILCALGVQWILIQRLLLPWHLSADASYRQIVPGTGWMAAGLLLLAAAAVLVGAAWRRRDRALLWGTVLVVAAGVVSSNVLVPIGTILAERLAYLPSAGALWILVESARRVRRRGRSGPVVVLGLGLLWGVLLVARTAVRAADWRDDLTLFGATVRDAPRSTRAWTNYAVALNDLDRLDESLRASQMALALVPGYPPALEVRATALARSGHAEEAVRLLRPVLSAPSPRPRSLLELGNAYLTLGEGAAAESVFQAVMRFLPADDARPIIGLASASALEENWRASASRWRTAAVLSPGDTGVHRAWAYALWQAGEPDSAEATYRELVRRDAHDALSLNDLAWFIMHTGRGEQEALALARRAFALSPSENNADTLTEALRRTLGPAAARAWVDSVAAAPGGPQLAPEILDTLRARCARPMDHDRRPPVSTMKEGS